MEYALIGLAFVTMTASLLMPYLINLFVPPSSSADARAEIEQAIVTARLDAASKRPNAYPPHCPVRTSKGGDAVVTIPRHSLPSLQLFINQAITLTATNGALDPLVVPVLTRGVQRSVRVWKDRLDAIDQGDAAAAWLAKFLGNTTFRLVRLKDTFKRPCDPEFAPDHITVTAVASLTALEQKLDRPLDILRFRPNIVLGGCPAWADDVYHVFDILGQDGNLRFRNVKPCSRCSVPSVNPATGAKDDEVAGTISLQDVLKAHRYSAMTDGPPIHGAVKSTGGIDWCQIELGYSPHMLFNLDREALSPLFVYCEAMEHFVDSIHKTKALDGANNAGVSPLSPSPTTTARDTLSPRFKRSGVAPMPLTIPLTPGRPKRFIELPKQERHVLQVAFYLKDVLTKLAGSISSKPAGKFKSHRMPVVAASTTTTTVDILPLDVVRALRAIKTKLRKNEFFADLPNLVADAGKISKGGDSRQANTHQAFSSFFLCLHEVVRSTSYHSIELADGAFDLLGEVLRAIQNYIVEVVGQRKKHRSRIRGLRALRQQLRAQFAAMEAETHDIAQEAIKLSTVLSAIEFELDVLHDECEWHAQSKRLFLDTVRYDANRIGALRDASDQPPLVFVNADGSSKVLQPGTAILRAENVPHIRYLVQLLALSRSFVHVRLNDPRVMDANPSRKLTLNKLNHQGRAETLKMHLMNQRPRDAAAAAVDPTPPPNGNEGAAGGASLGDKSAAAAANALHKVTDAELTALSSIHECLRGTACRCEMASRIDFHDSQLCFNPADSISSGGVSSGPDNSTGAVVLARELAKLPMPWRTAFSLLHDDETATLLSKDEMLHDVSAIYAAYDDVR
ncbi:hypothetical protein DYB31_002182 [Aphanomyces astaci]|uniref:MOSC domain-containing protein n=2 Tax=Aphanomyces astaci TaxID=112090 RepID=A0A397FNC6_APHAT|nr:hypothetical protein DYB31_002182 [Aphanomyces astaci]